VNGVCAEISWTNLRILVCGFLFFIIQAGPWRSGPEITSIFTSLSSGVHTHRTPDVQVLWHRLYETVPGTVSCRMALLILRHFLVGTRILTPFLQAIGIYVGAGSVDETGYVYSRDVTEADLRTR